MSHSMKITNNIILALFLTTQIVSAKVATEDGTSKLFWHTRAIVIFKVTKIRGDKNGDYMDVEIEGVAATDNLVPSQLAVKYSWIESGLRIEPKVDMVFLACIFQQQGEWCLENNTLTFFPSQCAIWPIKGLDDPELTPILQNIFHLRDTVCGLDKLN
jgi:hypothetical protein